MGHLSKFAEIFSLASKKDYMRDYMRNRYRETRKNIIDRLGGKCSNCGNQDGPFHLDHIDASKKTHRAADLHSVNDEDFDAEVSNLQLLCPECHVEKTKDSWDYGSPKPTHGYWMYRKHGCRCKKCTEEYKKKNKEWNSKSD